jgi:hypothetical protein
MHKERRRSLWAGGALAAAVFAGLGVTGSTPAAFGQATTTTSSTTTSTTSATTTTGATTTTSAATTTSQATTTTRAAAALPQAQPAQAVKKSPAFTG